MRVAIYQLNLLAHLRAHYLKPIPLCPKVLSSLKSLNGLERDIL
jgi:hypothetical protein